MRIPRFSFRVCALAFCAAMTLACSRSGHPVVPFTAYTREAVVAARDARKPVLVLCTASWCGSCQRLHRGALSDGAVKTALDGFATLEVDHSDESQNTADVLESLGVKFLPALIFTDRNGNETARFEGDQPSETIIEAAKTARGK